MCRSGEHARFGLLDGKRGAQRRRLAGRHHDSETEEQNDGERVEREVGGIVHGENDWRGLPSRLRRVKKKLARMTLYRCARYVHCKIAHKRSHKDLHTFDSFFWSLQGGGDVRPGLLRRESTSRRGHYRQGAATGRK